MHLPPNAVLGASSQIIASPYTWATSMSRLPLSKHGTLTQCWDSVADVGLTLKRHWVNRHVELITRDYSSEILIQCCFNVRQTSATLATIKPTFGDCAVFSGKVHTVNTHEDQLFLDPHGDTTIFVLTQSPHERIGELFTHRCCSSI